MMFAAHFLPDTLSGWFVVASSVTVVSSAIVGAIMFVMKKMLETLEAKIDGIRINQQENTDATLRAVQRVQDLEVTINNGLTHRTQETMDDVAEIKACQVKLASQVAEIHGWMAAMQKWDGTDRRI